MNACMTVLVSLKWSNEAWIFAVYIFAKMAFEITQKAFINIQRVSNTFSLPGVSCYHPLEHRSLQDPQERGVPSGRDTHKLGMKN